MVVNLSLIGQIDLIETINHRCYLFFHTFALLDKPRGPLTGVRFTSSVHLPASQDLCMSAD